MQLVLQEFRHSGLGYWKLFVCDRSKIKQNQIFPRTNQTVDQQESISLPNFLRAGFSLAIRLRLACVDVLPSSSFFNRTNRIRLAAQKIR